MSQELTAEMANNLLCYDKETGALTWRIKVAQNVPAGKRIESRDSNGYITLMIHGRKYFAHRVVWLMTTGCWPKEHIDHIDGDPSNNKISNLREATNGQNKQNSRINRNNTSGFKGVSWARRQRSWRARIGHEGTRFYLGYFKSFDEACAAYRSAAINLHGEFANVDSIRGNK